MVPSTPHLDVGMTKGGIAVRVCVSYYVLTGSPDRSFPFSVLFFYSLLMFSFACF